MLEDLEDPADAVGPLDLVVLLDLDPVQHTALHLLVVSVVLED